MKRRSIALGLVALLVLVASPAARAAVGPVPAVKATWSDTNLPPGGTGRFTVVVRNVGDAPFSAGLAIVDELPTGVTATKITWRNTDFAKGAPTCAGIGTETVGCELDAADIANGAGKAPGKKLLAEDALDTLTGNGGGFNPHPTGYLPQIDIDVAIDPAASGTNTATVSGGGVSQSASDEDEVPFASAPAGFGLVPGSFEADVFSAAFPFGQPVRQAGDHPFEFRTDFDLAAHVTPDGSETASLPNGLIRTAEVTLPRGTIGNPEATPKCEQADFGSGGASANGSACPADTQVGYLNVAIGQGLGELTRVPIYNLQPPKGVPADFGFIAGSWVQAHIYPTLDPAQNYAIKAVTPDISALVSVLGSEVTFWGVPGDPVHDFFRFYPQLQENGDVAGAPFGGAPIRPLLTTPMDCGFDNGGARIRVASYQNPDDLTPAQEYASPLNVEGCDDQRFRFEPDIALQPTDSHAGAPTGLDVHLEVPQRNDEAKEATDLYAENGNVKGISTPPIKKAVVRLPEGMTISPSAAQGLGNCSPEQIGLGTDKPVTCPDNSQYGTLTLHTPLFPIDAQPKGFIYVAKQNDNPFHNFLSLYLVIEEPERGILVKVPGRVDLDPDTGQIITTFDDLPQFPVSDFQLSLKGGVRAALVNPSTCGQKTITAEFFSWQDPGTPHTVKDHYEVSQRPDGSSCFDNLGERPFKPTLQAGTINNTAGSFSPFALRLTRTDDDQEFSQLGVTLPAGLSAKLAGVSECTDAAIHQAEAPGRTGLEEQFSPSCPASSLIGSTEVGAGVGVPLTYVPGKVYLAGPYRGAPLSIVAITPAVVGPYDLGAIAVRSALRVNRETTEVTVQSDPFPQIFKGIPVRIRDIRVRTDRPSFSLNPTSCAQKQIGAHVTGTGGNVASTADDTAADLANRFQAADCASLGFKPKLSFRLLGGTHRGSHPRFKATLRARPGDANIAGASVALPHSEFLDQGHIKTVCTRVQFAAHSCPAGSAYGYAIAKTPLLDRPVQGPVYLRSSSHQLPDLVASLDGQIGVDLVGRIDSVNGGIRNTFEVVPDAPVSEFTLTMQGGKRGLLVNSTDLCKSTNRATAKFTGQNGKAVTLHPEMQSACGKRERGHKRR